MKREILKNKISTYRRKIEYISIILGIVIPLTCFFLLPKMDILFEPLSIFGISKETSSIWFIFIQFISITLFALNYGRSNLKTLAVLNTTSSLSLSLVGIIDMNTRFLHNSFALIFFLSYTGYIFWYGYNLIHTNTKSAIMSISISIFIILSSFISIVGLELGYGIFELIFISSIIFWNKTVK